MLAKGGRPAGRVAARKTDKGASAREVVEQGNILGQLDRVHRRQIHTQLANPQRFGVLGHEVIPEQGVGRGLDPLNL